jgi:RNA polymerase sigma-70 factor, ECF subfamily
VETVFAARLLPGARAADEESWLAAARLKEPWALERFYVTYHEQVYALCHRMLGRSEDAQDAMQTAFVRAFREMHRFRGDSSLKTWIYRIAVNEAISLVRKRRTGQEPLDAAEGVADGAPTAVERLAVQAALAQTRPAHRAVLVLRYWEGLTYEEIADVLNISLSAARMRLLRARDEFRRCYEEE